MFKAEEGAGPGDGMQGQDQRTELAGLTQKLTGPQAADVFRGASRRPGQKTRDDGEPSPWSARQPEQKSEPGK